MRRRGWRHRSGSQRSHRSARRSIREALEADDSLDGDARVLADGDADPGATPADLRRAMDTVLVRELGERMKHLIAEAATRREALAEYRQLELRWKDAKARLGTAPQD